jgi:hypothetical protein
LSTAYTKQGVVLQSRGPATVYVKTSQRLGVTKESYNIEYIKLRMTIIPLQQHATIPFAHLTVPGMLRSSEFSPCKQAISSVMF